MLITKVRDKKVRGKTVNQLIVSLLGIASLGWSLISCQTSSPRTTKSPVEAITQTTCEDDRDFAFIPDGPFYFGSTKTEVDDAYEMSATAAAPSPDQIPDIKRRLQDRRWFAGEPIQQQVNLPAFCLQRNLVTNADYKAFTQATGHRVPFISAEDYKTQGFLVHPYETVQRFLWQNGTYPKGQGQHPVVLVSYEDAIAYAQWKGKQDQSHYRLPTHQEWEKALVAMINAIFLGGINGTQPQRMLDIGPSRAQTPLAHFP